MGQVLYRGVRPSLQKILPPKIFGFRILNLILRNKKVEETPVKQYAALRAARLNFSEIGLSFILAHLYTETRPFFMGNPV